MKAKQNKTKQKGLNGFTPFGEGDRRGERRRRY
jgi:hypothetical protein